MTDAEAESPFLLGDGECMVFDAEYLDPAAEAVGVLAVQWSVDRGMWALIGSHDDAGKYSQGWVEVGRASPRAKLRPVN